MVTRGTIVGGGGYRSKGVQHYVFARVDLDARTPIALPSPIDFLVHGISVDPRHSTHAVCFEKQGPGACLIDLASGAVIRAITTSPTRQFYGHGAWSRDGSLLYATESHLDKGLTGALVVRDGSTLAELGTLPTHGVAPHDCQLVDDGRVMAIAHGGGLREARGAPPCVTWVDLASERLLERVLLDSPRFNAGHLRITSSGDLALVSAPRAGLPEIDRQLGALSLRPRGRRLKTLAEPTAVTRRMIGETLSVVVHEATRLVVATHPLGDCVSLWRLDDGAHLGVLELINPRGVALTLDESAFVVSHMTPNGPQLSAWRTDDLSPTTLSVTPSYLTGSHIFVLSPASSA
jgi:hypothetical protein